MERGPEVSAGMRWLEATILTAKLHLQANPQWLVSHSVVDGFGERGADEIVRMIEAQLRRRLSWVNPPDPVMCDLFYQAALRLNRVEHASLRDHYLRESLRFGDWRKREIAALRRT